MHRTVFLNRVDTAFDCGQREFCIDNLLDRIHLIIVMIRWTGVAPWEFEFPFPGSLTSTLLFAGPTIAFEEPDPPEAFIYFTTDGSAPSASSQMWTEDFKRDIGLGNSSVQVCPPPSRPGREDRRIDT